MVPFFIINNVFNSLLKTIKEVMVRLDQVLWLGFCYMRVVAGFFWRGRGDERDREINSCCKRASTVHWIEQSHFTSIKICWQQSQSFLHWQGDSLQESCIFSFSPSLLPRLLLLTSFMVCPSYKKGIVQLFNFPQQDTLYFVNTYYSVKIQPSRQLNAITLYIAYSYVCTKKKIYNFNPESWHSLPNLQEQQLYAYYNFLYT